MHPLRQRILEVFRRRGIPAALGVTLLLIYTRTLLPGVGGTGDTAKFQFVGRYLGTPHATGYPTYIFLNHVFTSLFPLGSTAYRANLLSAVFATLACLVLYQTLVLHGVSRWIAVATALTLGLTTTLWSYAVVAEVYTLHLLFVSAVIFFLTLWMRTGRDRHFYLWVGCLAFAFGNHMTSLWLVPAVAYAIWACDRRALRDRRKWVWVAALFGLSGLQYLYFVWRTHDPTTVYLEMRASSLRQFLWYVTGAQFRSAFLAFTPVQLLTVRLPVFGKFLWDQLSVLLVLAVVGFVSLSSRRLQWLLGLYFVANAAYALNYAIPDIDAYFLPNVYVLVLCLGFGAEAIMRSLGSWGQRAVILAALVMPLSLAAVNFRKVDQHDNTAKEKETLATLRAVDHDGLVISFNYDVYEYLMYYRIAEGWGARNIHLVYRQDPSAVLNDVKSYLRGANPYGEVPAKLSVFLTGVSAEVVGRFSEGGLAVKEAKAGLLFRIALPAMDDNSSGSGGNSGGDARVAGQIRGAAIGRRARQR